MYKFQSKQLTLMSFGMPWGMELDPNNEWVIKANLIDWEASEKLYVEEYFKDKKTGHPAKHFRLVLGSLLIQKELKVSDRRLVKLITENPYLQYFCGLPEYTQKPPFDPSSLVYFRKRISVDMVNKINEMIIAKGLKLKVAWLSKQEDPKIIKKHNLNNDLIIDSSCAPQNISYPNDISLLNRVREKLEMFLRMTYNPFEEPDPCPERKIARKSFLTLIMNSKKTSEDIRQAIGVQLGYIYGYINKVLYYFSIGRKLAKRHMSMFNVICLIYQQQQHMYEHHVNKIENRILSLHAWWVRSIYRNKSGRKYEYGSQFDISVDNGFARLEHLSFDPYNEAITLPMAVEKYFLLYGRYPDRVVVDMKYRTEEHVLYCMDKKIKLIGKQLKKKQTGPAYSVDEERENSNRRTEVERKLSHAKGSFCLDQINTLLPETTKTSIALSILAMNLDIAMKFAILLFFVMINTSKHAVLNAYRSIYELSIALLRGNGNNSHNSNDFFNDGLAYADR